MADHPPDDPAIRIAVNEACGSGTGLFGDISNTSAPTKALAETGTPAVVFSELLGFNEPDGSDVVARALDAVRESIAECPGLGDVRPGLAAHAPYSVSSALFRAIRHALDDDPSMPISVHLAESREELEFLETGRGAWRAVLEERGRWDPTWRPHHGGVVAYLDDLGWLTSRTLVVHGVQLTDPELERLARAGTTLVTCPSSNQWTGAGLPPVDRFYASGVRVAVGTDSLASAPDLNLFREMAEIRRLAPDVPASDVLSSATRVGAVALGFLDRGSIEVGKRAALIAVRCPETLDDVEEYLLTGIDADQVVVLD
jgi:cytosine/adenosine deaminase-related metal-dependent hydrolase